MKTFTAYGETTHVLFDCDGNKIGEDSGHRPVYIIKAKSESAAHRAPLSKWVYTGDSNGTHGADFDGDYDYNDVEDEDVILYGVYNIEECNDCYDDYF